MAVEAKRGCGYRKVGGLYLVAKGVAVPCDRLPYPLHVCPTCGGGIKQSRGFQYITGNLLNGPPPCKGSAPGCPACPMCNPPSKLGLMWVGAEHYATPADWSKEAATLGVSKRISAVPKDFEFGKTWVLVAHPKAVSQPCPKGKGNGVHQHDTACACGGTGTVYTPGIFTAFRPEAVELIVTKALRRQRWVKALQRKLGSNLRLVEVPEGDKDHAPVVRQSARKRAMARVARKAAAGEEE